MHYLDSWLWVEYFVQGSKLKRTEEIVEMTYERGGVISALVLTEVKYRLARHSGATLAGEAMRSVQSFPQLEIIPATREIALSAADLWHKYYRKGGRELSHIDAVHLATAVATECEVLYSGDPDFADIEEIPTEVI